MVQGIPYVHWKIKDAVDLAQIDPVYLWGTIIETDKGPVDTPVFCTNAKQVKQIFNYNLEPFFVNGGRSVVIVRAYGGKPSSASFDFQLNETFRYAYVDYEYYDNKKDDTSVVATVQVDDPNVIQPKVVKKDDVTYSFDMKSIPQGTASSTTIGSGAFKTIQKVTIEVAVDTTDSGSTGSSTTTDSGSTGSSTTTDSGDSTTNSTPQTTKVEYTEVQITSFTGTVGNINDRFVGRRFYIKTEDLGKNKSGVTAYRQPNTAETKFTIDIKTPSAKTIGVRFYQGRWRSCEDTKTSTSYGAIKYWDNDELKTSYMDGNGGYFKDEEHTTSVDPITMQSFNESDVSKSKIAKIKEIEDGTNVVHLETIYPGNFIIPVTISKDKRTGYRISVKESDDYTILLSGITTLSNIVKKINERANNIEASLKPDGEDIENVFNATPILAVDGDGNPLPRLTEPDAIDAYTKKVIDADLPVGAIFSKVPENEEDSPDFSFKLIETSTFLANGSNGTWNDQVHRIADPSSRGNRQLIAAAHKEALDHLATIKLSGIFCNYGEDEVQKVYADHVSTTEPQGMNSAEVCKWRTLILGANAIDRIKVEGDTPGDNLADKAISLDNENILFLGQGLIDDGYAPESNLMKATDDTLVSLLNDDEGALPNQLLPFQCTQYVAGLRSKLFYGDAIFGGEAKKEIVGVGNLSIAPLFAGESKLLWQPDNYATLNQYGVLTFTNDYNLLSLTDGVTTRQTPLEEDEEGVQSIVKYAKHIVHEELQRFIGRNLTGDLEVIMENAVRGILNVMQTQDQTLLAVPQEGLPAYDVEIVLIPKSNAQQLLAKAYVYLKLTPVHALRQIEVELTVQ